MNAYKSIKRRARQIVRAAMGKPVARVTVGVEVKSCKDCERTACKDCPTTHNYERLLETRSCINCGRRQTCTNVPQVGQTIRINCIEWQQPTVEMEG